MWIVYGGFFFALMARLIFIQATGEVYGQPLAAKAADKYDRKEVLQASRGRILDSIGRPIAEDTLSYKLIAVIGSKATTHPARPHHVTAPAETAQVLAKYIDMPQAEIQNRLMRNQIERRPPERELYQVEFGTAGKNLPYETMHKIDIELKKKNLHGIQFEQDLKRHYPNGVFASHLIGFAQKEKNADGSAHTVGKMGLEATYNKELGGTDGSLEYNGDVSGYMLPDSVKKRVPPRNGQDIYLTIDKTIQNFVEDALTKVETAYRPEKISVLVADPKTGRILAMAQRPTFDPDTRRGLTANWLNENVEAPIEPGSTFKVFTVAAAMENRKWDAGAYYRSGSYKLLDRTIHDVNVNGWGTITFQEGFQRSSNVSMAYLLKRMGPEAFLGKMKEFGFGQKTGIDLPREAPGIINRANPVSVLTTTYGQGSTVTPIQMVQAMTAVTGDGAMMKPYLIQKITDPNTGKTLLQNRPEKKHAPISADTAKRLRALMATTVTSPKGTAQRFQIDGYTVGGKTGTAQMATRSGGYTQSRNEFLYSFIGFAPVEDPKLIVYVTVHRPKLPGGEYGSAPVAQIFNPVMLNSLKYLNVQPAAANNRQPVALPALTGQPGVKAEQALAKAGLSPIVIGDPTAAVTAQYPAPGERMPPKARAFLKTSGTIKLPNFSGWSKRDLLVYQSLSALPLRLSGEGYAVNQSASPGLAVAGGAPIVIQLQTPDKMGLQLQAEEMATTGG